MNPLSVAARGWLRELWVCRRTHPLVDSDSVCDQAVDQADGVPLGSF